MSKIGARGKHVWLYLGHDDTLHLPSTRIDTMPHSWNDKARRTAKVEMENGHGCDFDRLDPTNISYLGRLTGNRVTKKGVHVILIEDTDIHMVVNKDITSHYIDTSWGTQGHAWCPLNSSGLLDNAYFKKNVAQTTKDVFRLVKDTLKSPLKYPEEPLPGEYMRPFICAGGTYYQLDSAQASYEYYQWCTQFSTTSPSVACKAHNDAGCGKGYNLSGLYHTVELPNAPGVKHNIHWLPVGSEVGHTIIETPDPSALNMAQHSRAGAASAARRLPYEVFGLISEAVRNQRYFVSNKLSDRPTYVQLSGPLLEQFKAFKSQEQPRDDDTFRVGRLNSKHPKYNSGRYFEVHLSIAELRNLVLAPRATAAPAKYFTEIFAAYQLHWYDATSPHNMDKTYGYWLPIHNLPVDPMYSIGWIPDEFRRTPTVLYRATAKAESACTISLCDNVGRLKM